MYALVFFAAILSKFALAQSSLANPFSIEQISSLCNKTFADANGTGVYSFDPNVFQGAQSGEPDNHSGLALNASWAFTVYENGTSTQGTLWYSTNGANYSNDFALGYDVCGVQVLNLTLETQFNAQHDNGTCLSAIDQDCVNALQDMAANTARILVANPSSYGPSSNLSNGVLPTVCDDIATAIKSNFPKECKKYYNETIEANGFALTDYNNTHEHGRCCSDLQERDRCPINDTFWPVAVEFDPEDQSLAYTEYAYVLFPTLSVFMPVADYQRSGSFTPISQLTCIHLDHYNAGSRVPPPMPKPPPAKSGLSEGAIAGIVVGVLVWVGLIFGLGFCFWRRRRTSRTAAVNTQAVAPTEEQKYGSDVIAPKVDAMTAPPHMVAPNYEGPAELSPEEKRPELPTTKSHERYELASPQDPVELPSQSTLDKKA